ncbi:uncharacterized protein LOC110437076 isoform X2 [Sorghum bicolor]|uniref:uncharacterized protein LOC110437076 isoform X2 n=1 Tax=Sorghum bicolor TaxID=4558 RepID=UPI000B4261AD|nr:uncharacterized protein LOC110437076 isoform X2 [Sorghum bicolor]|eukprot:XP_021320908.1 uncharacterized protein LOC110437076 isoform X2 [Sorghum bicolor]
MVVDREKNILLSHRCSPVRHEYISKIRKLHPIHSRQVYTDSYVSCNDKIIADYGEHEGHTSLLHSTETSQATYRDAVTPMNVCVLAETQIAPATTPDYQSLHGDRPRTKIDLVVLMNPICAMLKSAV